jgi:hypothetical protein
MSCAAVPAAFIAASTLGKLSLNMKLPEFEDWADISPTLVALVWLWLLNSRAAAS